MYRPFPQAARLFFWFVVHTSGEPLRLTSALRQAVWEVDKDQPVHAVLSMEQIASESIAVRRVSMILLAAFSGVAVALACLGIYSVISYAASQRTHEFGIRIALGARPG